MRTPASAFLAEEVRPLSLDDGGGAERWQRAVCPEQALAMMADAAAPRKQLLREEKGQESVCMMRCLRLDLCSEPLYQATVTVLVTLCPHKKSMGSCFLTEMRKQRPFEKKIDAIEIFLYR